MPKPSKRKNPAAVALGRRGGKVTSEAKAIAARENGKKGGKPEGPLTMHSIRAAHAVTEWLKTLDGDELFARMGSVPWLETLGRIIQRARRL